MRELGIVKVLLEEVQENNAVRKQEKNSMIIKRSDSLNSITKEIGPVYDDPVLGNPYSNSLNSCTVPGCPVCANFNFYAKHINVTTPIPPNDEDRVKVVRQLKLLDTRPDKDYDRYTAFIARYFKVPSITHHYFQMFH